MIDSRWKPLGQYWSRAAFAAAILEWWRAQGCPPVHATDKLVQDSQKPLAKRTG